MADELKRAMEALVAEFGGITLGEGLYVLAADAAAFSLRERDAAVEQARTDEREAWERVLPQIRIDSGDVEVVDDDQGPFLSPQFIAKAMAAAIRARGER